MTRAVQAVRTRPLCFVSVAFDATVSRLRSPSSSSLSPISRAFSRPMWYRSVDELTPGRLRLQNLVVWSLLALTSTWPSGWNVIDQMFESCAYVSFSLGAGSGSVQCKIEPSDPPETSMSSWTGCHATAARQSSLVSARLRAHRAWQLTACLVVMASQRHKLLHRSNVKHLDQLVARRRRDHVAVWAPAARLHRVLVPVTAISLCQRCPRGPGKGGHSQCRHDLRCTRVPELDQVVLAA